MCIHRRVQVIDARGFVQFAALGNNQNTFALAPNNKPRNPKLVTGNGLKMPFMHYQQSESRPVASTPWSVVTKQ